MPQQSPPAIHLTSGLLTWRLYLGFISSALCTQAGPHLIPLCIAAYVFLELSSSHSSSWKISGSRLGCPPESPRSFEILNSKWDLVSGSRTRACGFESLSSNSLVVTAAMGPQCLVNKPQLLSWCFRHQFFTLSLTSLFFAYPKVCPVMMMTVAVSWSFLPMLRLSSVVLLYQEYPFFFASVSLNYSFHSRASLNGAWFR